MHRSWRGLVVALALSAGCASRSAGPGAARPPASEIPETPRPGDPVVTLLDPGAEPRAPLRYRIPPGQKGTLVMDVHVAMSMSMAGHAMPVVTTPPVRMTASMEVPEVAPDGASRTVTTIRAVDVQAKPEDEPRVVEAMKSSLAGIVGLTTEMWLTPRGFARDVKIDVPQGLRPEMEAVLQAMRNVTEQVAAIFPFEPVGLGARWRIVTEIDTGRLKLLQTGIMTLVRRDANHVFLSGALEQTAPPQPIKAPGLPVGASVSLERYVGNGEGQLDTALDSRIPHGQIAIKATMATAVVTNGARMSLGMNMDTAVSFSPGPAP